MYGIGNGNSEKRSRNWDIVCAEQETNGHESKS